MVVIGAERPFGFHDTLQLIAVPCSGLGPSKMPFGGALVSSYRVSRPFNAS